MYRGRRVKGIIIAHSTRHLVPGTFFYIDSEGDVQIDVDPNSEYTHQILPSYHDSYLRFSDAERTCIAITRFLFAFNRIHEEGILGSERFFCSSCERLVYNYFADFFKKS